MFNTRSMISRLMLSVAIITSSILAYAASAHAGARSADVSVYVGDLDLKSEAGAKTALRRIGQAASRACGGPRRLTDIRGARAYRMCVQDITGRAVKQLGSPTVTTLHKKKAQADRVALRNAAAPN